MSVEICHAKVKALLAKFAGSKFDNGPKIRRPTGQTQVMGQAMQRFLSLAVQSAQSLPHSASSQAQVSALG